MSTAKAKATLVALGLLFLIPLALAWMMYIGVIDYRPGETSNRGTLIRPPVKASLPADFERHNLNGHWILVYPLSLECGDNCLKDLVGLRQVRRALGREGDRVRTALLVDGPPGRALSGMDEGIHADFLVTGGGALRAQISQIAEGRGTYLIDPMGNIMMHYQPGSNPDYIRRDLEHLLKYAKTDPQ